MKVSILVPIYGVEKYIERCAISLFEQTYIDIEYVFVNDCTKDNSIFILNNIIERYPKRKPHIRIIEQEHNMGLGIARNTAVKYATGEFIMHVDSDDYIDTTCVEKCVAKQIETHADFVSFNARRIMPSFSETLYLNVSNERERLLHMMLSFSAPSNIWGRLIDARLYKEHGIEVESGCNMGEDMQVTPRLLYNAKNVAYINEDLYYYDNTNENAYSSSFSRKKAEDTWMSYDVLCDYFKDKGDSYTDDLILLKLRKASNFLINALKSSPIDFGYFYKMRELIKTIDTKYYKNIDKPTQLALKIRNAYMCCIYVRAASYTKKFMKRMIRRSLAM